MEAMEARTFLTGRGSVSCLLGRSWGKPKIILLDEATSALDNKAAAIVGAARSFDGQANYNGYCLPSFQNCS